MVIKINSDLLVESIDYLSKNSSNDKVVELFSMLDNKLATARYNNRLLKERNRKVWYDDDLHGKRVLFEEAKEIDDEWNDNYTLFQLASFLQHENIMHYFFAKMIKNLSDIRIRISDRTERQKISWDDAKTHFDTITEEEHYETICSVNDLLRMYKIAQNYDYKPGMDLINKLFVRYNINISDYIDEAGTISLRK